ncbi:beta-N-acetylhexosaminidase [Thermopolyspora sp. NPDC052614]|uniref:beta-N-acetylhexosaminidase n=1 Tax=Thermopolyspora sp. NPDC052614 TaxID=3155682 RepID=UPI00341F31A1
MTVTALLPLPRLAETTPGSLDLAPGGWVSGPPDLVESVRLALAVLDPCPAPGGHPDGAGPVAIDVVADPGLGAEAYTLAVTPDGVRIAAGDASGAFYAGQTLRQLLGPDAFRSTVPRGTRWSVPCVRVADGPRFAWRGAHLDVARHFFPKREVLRMIDLLAAHKLNRLHLHLVDDQGWRVESRAFPLLQELAAYRPRTIVSHYGEEDVFDETPHGGCYTLADLAEIGAYAAARGVTVVPEIDVPGHASAVVAAYPAFGARPSGAHQVLDRWGISSAILSPLPPTVEFLGTVFDEIITALGGATATPYFHIGGDECVLDDWAASAEITAFRRSLGVETPAGLHAWFLRTLADMLASYGIRAVVWDEAFVSGGLREDTVVMPWRGPGVARRAAAAGHSVVATPVFPLYFDYAEAASAQEPLAIGDAITVADVASFEPAPSSWRPGEAANVIGAQFQLWSERIPDGRVLDYRAWPRGCALAEVAWSGGPRDVADLIARLTAEPGGHLARLDAYGVEYRPLAGPRPWQRGGAGMRRHRPGVVDVAMVARHLERLTHDADSTRPSV